MLFRSPTGADVVRHLGSRRHPSRWRLRRILAGTPLHQEQPESHSDTDDRDKRWERVNKAYDALVAASGIRAPSAHDAIANSYKEKVTDEFVVPSILGNYAGARDGDVLLFANFRPDRAREISTALLDPAFDGDRKSTRLNSSHT